MIGRGYCGVGVFHGKAHQNIGTLWRSAHAFGADFIFTVGRRYDKQPADTSKAWTQIPLYHYNDMDDLRAHLPFSCRLVAVELNERAKPLNRFVHPEQAVYLLGAEDHGIPANTLADIKWVVQVPGASYCLNVATAGSIVLYDRLVKMANGSLVS